MTENEEEKRVRMYIEVGRIKNALHDMYRGAYQNAMSGQSFN